MMSTMMNATWLLSKTTTMATQSWVGAGPTSTPARTAVRRNASTGRNEIVYLVDENSHVPGTQEHYYYDPDSKAPKNKYPIVRN